LEGGGEAVAIQADVSDFQQAHELIRESTEKFGQIDILVNNAGTTRDMLLMMMKESQWDLVIDTNLKSVFNCSKAVARGMVRQRGGRIINITSVAGLAGNPGQTNYAASNCPRWSRRSCCPGKRRAPSPGKHSWRRVALWPDRQAARDRYRKHCRSGLSRDVP